MISVSFEDFEVDYFRYYIKSEEQTISYITSHEKNEGNLPMIILLHPSGTNAEIMLRQMSYLDEDYYCVAPDLRGYGKSRIESGLESVIDEEQKTTNLDSNLFAQNILHYFSLKDYASDVVKIISTLRDENQDLIILGNSLGAYVALKIARDYPQLDSSFVVCGLLDKVPEDEKSEWVNSSLEDYAMLTSENLSPEAKVLSFTSLRRQYWGGRNGITPLEWERNYREILEHMQNDYQRYAISHIGANVAVAYGGNDVLLYKDRAIEVGEKLPHIPLNGQIGKNFSELLFDVLT